MESVNEQIIDCGDNIKIKRTKVNNNYEIIIQDDSNNIKDRLNYYINNNGDLYIRDLSVGKVIKNSKISGDFMKFEIGDKEIFINIIKGMITVNNINNNNINNNIINNNNIKNNNINENNNNIIINNNINENNNGNIIKVKFTSPIDGNFEFSYNENTPFHKLECELCEKCPRLRNQLIAFLVGGIKVEKNKSLRENNIKEGSTIIIVEIN